MPQPSHTAAHAEPRPARFVSARPQAMLTILLLMFSIVVALLAAASQLMFLSLDSDPHGETRYKIAWVLQLVLFAATALVFCLWVFRAYRNLNVIQLTPPTLTAIKAVEGFFIPIINLHHPLEVLWQLWAGSSHSGRERNPVVLAWWLTFLGSWVVTLLAGIFDLLKIWGPIQLAVWSIVSQVLWIASAVFGVMVIRSIDMMQTERVQMVADLQSGPAVPISAAHSREPHRPSSGPTA